MPKLTIDAPTNVKQGEGAFTEKKGNGFFYNPVTGTLTLPHTTSNDPQKLTIFSANGKAVYSNIIESSVIPIKSIVPDLAGGAYHIIFQTDGAKQTAPLFYVK